MKNIKELESVKWEEYLKEDKIFMGFNENDEAIYIDESEFQNTFISGQNGSGKGILTELMLKSILFNFKKNTDELHLIQLFNGGCDIERFEDLNDENIQSHYKTKETIEFIFKLEIEMMARLEYMRENKLRQLESNNIYVYIDCIKPITDLYMKKGIDRQTASEVNQALERIATMGKTTNIKLIIATQNPTLDFIESNLRNQLPNRILMKTIQVSHQSVVMPLDFIDEENNPRDFTVGKGIYFNSYSNETKIFQSVFNESLEYHNSEKIIIAYKMGQKLESKKIEHLNDFTYEYKIKLIEEQLVYEDELSDMLADTYKEYKKELEENNELMIELDRLLEETTN